MGATPNHDIAGDVPTSVDCHASRRRPGRLYPASHPASSGPIGVKPPSVTHPLIPLLLDKLPGVLGRLLGTTAGDTVGRMSSAKIAISLAPEALKQVDQLVEGGMFPSRSKLIQDAVDEKLQRLRRVRLAQECAKLQPFAERA